VIRLAGWLKHCNLSLSLSLKQMVFFFNPHSNLCNESLVLKTQRLFAAEQFGQ